MSDWGYTLIIGIIHVVYMEVGCACRTLLVVVPLSMCVTYWLRHRHNKVLWNVNSKGTEHLRVNVYVPGLRIYNCASIAMLSG